MSVYTVYETNDLILTVPVNSGVVNRLLKELEESFRSNNPGEFQDSVYLTGCVLTVGGLFDNDFQTILIRYAHLFGNSEPSLFYSEESGAGYYCIFNGKFRTCGVRPDNDWQSYEWLEKQIAAALGSEL